jgi:predicted DCC family thiol-disulfide oxidoreductase YuxK
MICLTNNIEETTMTTIVFYNSACPVCDAGICYQKEKMQGQDVTWIDVHANPDAVNQVGTNLETVRERLHIIDSKGNVIVGAEAFSALMAQTKSQLWMARLSRLPIIKPILNFAYNTFARLLYIGNRILKRW